MQAAEAPLTQDAEIRADNPETRYGGRISKTVRGAQLQQSLLQFDLSVYSGQVLNATLTLPLKTVSRAGTFEVQRLLSDWSEDTLNFNNPPNNFDFVGEGDGFTRYQMIQSCVNLVMLAPGAIYSRLSQYPSGKKVLGGGNFGSNNSAIVVRKSHPSGDFRGWGEVVNTASTPLLANVMCVWAIRAKTTQ